MFIKKDLFFIFYFLFFIFLITSCEPNERTLLSQKDVCNNIDCSGHGVCEKVNNKAICKCDEGYYLTNLKCLPPFSEVYQFGTEYSDVVNSIIIDNSENFNTKGNIYLSGINKDKNGDNLFLRSYNNGFKDLSNILKDNHAFNTSLTIDKTKNNSLYLTLSGADSKLLKIEKNSNYEITWSSSWRGPQEQINVSLFAKFPRFITTNYNNNPIVVGTALDNDKKKVFLREYEKLDKDLSVGFIVDVLLKDKNRNFYENFISISTVVDKQNNIYIVGNQYNGDSNLTSMRLFKYKTTNNATVDIIEDIEIVDENFKFQAIAMTIDSSNNLYIVGAKHTENDPSKAFLLILNFDTGKKHLIFLEGNLTTIATAITLDKKNNIYITGFTDGNYENETNIGNSDIFLTKIFHDFDFIGENNRGKYWHRQIGTEKEDIAKGIVIDTNNNIWITGETQGSFSSNYKNQGKSDIFLMKIEQ